MQVTLLKSKIHRAIVSSVSPNYSGSLSIDRNLMEAAGFVDIELTTIGYDQSVGVESHNGKLFVSGRKPIDKAKV